MASHSSGRPSWNSSPDTRRERACYVYLPTNGRLLTPDVTDRLGDAGVATFNVAIDCIREKPGLPKALEPIRGNFDYLVKLQSRYGYTVFLSINITRFNLEDVRLLTEFGRQNGVATAYHLCESPNGHTSPFRSEELGPVDELLDYLIDRHRAGYVMVNSPGHLSRHEKSGARRRGSLAVPRRAEHGGVPHRRHAGALRSVAGVRTRLGNRRLPEVRRAPTGRVKPRCSESCFSTVGYMLANYYDLRSLAGLLSPRTVRRLSGR